MTRELFSASKPDKPLRPEDWGESERHAREAQQALEHPALKRALEAMDSEAVALFRGARSEAELISAKAKLDALEDLKSALWSKVHAFAHADLNRAKG